LGGITEDIVSKATKNIRKRKKIKFQEIKVQPGVGARQET